MEILHYCAFDFSMLMSTANEAGELTRHPNQRPLCIRATQGKHEILDGAFFGVIIARCYEGRRDAGAVERGSNSRG